MPISLQPPRFIQLIGTIVAGTCVAATSAVLVLPAAAAATAAAFSVVFVAVAVLRCERPPAAADPRDHALRRHLAICRRREEPAQVLVAAAAGSRRAMTAELRISDSAIMERRRSGSVLVAVVDGRDLSRTRITERLREKHGEHLRVGWATFPDDGLTLDALVELAAARARGVPVAETAVEHSVGERS